MKAYLFSICLTPIEEIRLPRYQKGNILRGAFGQSLRSLVCIYPEETCHECLIKKCVYRDFFNSLNSSNAEKLSKNQNIPRPFVIKPPLEQKEIYQHGEEIVFKMVVFGNAISFLPYLLVSLSTMAERGLGKFRGRARLERVVQEHPITGEQFEIYSPDGTVTAREQCYFTENDFIREGDSRITLRFLTPAIINDDGTLQRKPSFRAFIERLRDRFSSLSWFYEGVEPDIDFKTFADGADEIRIVKERLLFVQAGRRRRNGGEQDMSGVVGTVTYEGPMAKYLPYLHFGQYMHVGKASVFGYGWYQVEG